MVAGARGIDRRQALGVLLIILLLAATAFWRGSGSPTPQVLGPVHTTIEVDSAPASVDNRPEAVKIAEDVLGAHLEMPAADLPTGVTMTSPSAHIRVICAEGTCAALDGSTETYTYASGKGAAAKALMLLLHPEVARRRQDGRR